MFVGQIDEYERHALIRGCAAAVIVTDRQQAQQHEMAAQHHRDGGEPGLEVRRRSPSRHPTPTGRAATSSDDVTIGYKPDFRAHKRRRHPKVASFDRDCPRLLVNEECPHYRPLKSSGVSWCRDSSL